MSTPHTQHRPRCLAPTDIDHIAGMLSDFIEFATHDTITPHIDGVCDPDDAIRRATRWLKQYRPSLLRPQRLTRPMHIPA